MKSSESEQTREINLLKQKVMNLENILHGILQQIFPSSSETTLPQQIVGVMNASLNYWEATTGSSKVELAEESQIWKVQLDNNTCRTRGLDKYLQRETLPQKPRITNVIKTAEYVLSHCPPTHPELREHLESQLRQLQNQIKMNKLK